MVVNDLLVLECRGTAGVDGEEASCTVVTVRLVAELLADSRT